MWPRALLRPIAAVLFALMLAAAPAVAKPAMWVVRSPTATIYLFGTIHALRPDTDWRTPKFDRAFAQAKELWLEIGDGGYYRAALPLMQQLGTDYRHPLSSKLSKDDLDKLDVALKKSGVTNGRARVEWLRPWMVSMMLGGKLDGERPERGSGPDLTLQEDAVEADKPVHALETKEQQLHIFADLPPEVERGLLEEAIAHYDEGPARLEALFSAWLAGDVEKLGQIAARNDGPASAALYQKLLVERNKNWAVKIAELLKGSGTIMVAGGAAHFAGPDSVLVRLAAAGIKAERVQ